MDVVSGSRCNVRSAGAGGGTVGKEFQGLGRRVRMEDLKAGDLITVEDLEKLMLDNPELKVMDMNGKTVVMSKDRTVWLKQKQPRKRSRR